ncbi:trace amine-associated receptor 4-like [Gouania willdenowi]|uniref:trace amine-associated receptor 4-like n=1 Tax=Gouania willdenowi TaxID=441366 RepID=UPI0010542D62|nr:trace amine-associated receptor 4-like [Gouania willdenowi]
MELDFSFNRTDVVVTNTLLCNESDSNWSDEKHIASYLLCVFVGSLSVLITCGNLLVITSVVYFKQLHTPTNYLILSLAVADLLIGALVLPFSTILSVSTCWPLRGLLCVVRSIFDLSLCFTSILNLCFISVDRYYVVCQPLVYRTKITARVTAAMIAVSWAIPMFLATVVSVSGMRLQSSVNRCNLFQNSKPTIIGAISTSSLPAILISSLYFKIFLVAQKQARSIQTIFKSEDSNMEKKATKTLAIVVGIYLMCWSPYFLCVSFYPLSSGGIPILFIEAFKWLGWSNSMFNPFVYAFFYKWFRRAFKIVLSGKIFQSNFSDTNLI